MFGCTQNGIYRAGLDTERTTNATIFIYYGQCLGFFNTTFFIQWFGFYIQQIGQRLNSGFTTRGSTIDINFTGSNRFSIGATSSKTALSTLCLRQNFIDLINNWIALDLETH